MKTLMVALMTILMTLVLGNFGFADSPTQCQMPYDGGYYLLKSSTLKVALLFPVVDESQKKVIEAEAQKILGSNFYSMTDIPNAYREKSNSVVIAQKDGEAGLEKLAAEYANFSPVREVMWWGGPGSLDTESSKQAYSIGTGEFLTTFKESATANQVAAFAKKYGLELKDRAESFGGKNYFLAIRSGQAQMGAINQITDDCNFVSQVAHLENGPDSILKYLDPNYLEILPSAPWVP